MSEKNDAIIFLENFQSKLKSNKVITITVCFIAGIISVISVYMAFNYVSTNSEMIYILDHGSVLAAQRSNNDSQMDLEATDHVARFHELFFNLIPNTTSIQQNINRALDMSDASVNSFYNDLKEQRYYQTIIRNNAIQQILVDSIKVDMERYPYAAKTYAKVYILRESNITEYNFESTCELSRVSRTPANPHGLMLQKFEMTKYEKGETRKR